MSLLFFLFPLHSLLSLPVLLLLLGRMAGQSSSPTSLYSQLLLFLLQVSPRPSLIPLRMWQAAQELGIMWITVPCCLCLLLICFPLLWHGFLHMLQPLKGVLHLCGGCPRAAAPQGCPCPGMCCHNHCPLRVCGPSYLFWHGTPPSMSTHWAILPMIFLLTSPLCSLCAPSIFPPPSSWCPFFNMFAQRHPVHLQQLQLWGVTGSSQQFRSRLATAVVSPGLLMTISYKGPSAVSCYQNLSSYDHAPVFKKSIILAKNLHCFSYLQRRNARSPQYHR